MTQQTQQDESFLPDVLQHVENLRRQVGALHVKLCEISLQQRGGWFFGLQGGRIFTDPQDSVGRHTKKEERCSIRHLRPPRKLRKGCRKAADLRAMLRTLVLLRTRWGVLDTEVEELVGGEDKVWTFKTFKNRVTVTFRSETTQLHQRRNLSHDLPPVEEHFVSFPEAIMRHSWLLFTCSRQSTQRNRRHKKQQRSCSTGGKGHSQMSPGSEERRADVDSRESLNLRYRKSTTIPISDTATAAPIRTPVSYKTRLRFEKGKLGPTQAAVHGGLPPEES